MASVTPASVNENSQILSVYWTLMVDIGRCPGYYKITWNEFKGSEVEVQNTTSYNISGLDTWTPYNVCVDSGTHEGFFGDPVCENGTTAEGSKFCNNKIIFSTICHMLGLLKVQPSVSGMFRDKEWAGLFR